LGYNLLYAVVDLKHFQNRIFLLERSFMPTVLQIDGFKVRILTNDHEPAHLHVVRAGGEAKIRLGLKGEAPALLQISKGMTDREAAKAYGIVTRHNEELIQKWSEIHGQ
jgi:hypothetical protein